MSKAILQGYEAASADLIDRFEAVSPAELFAPVRQFLPEKPSRILDAGAGTGRDAAWFAALGHTVFAVEPVAAFREAGTVRHKSTSIEWVDDNLPGLSKIIDYADKFDFIILSAVWQHLDDPERQAALANLRVLASHGALIVMSIRHGAGAPTRKAYPASICDTQEWASQNGFRMIFEVSAQSAQKNNRLAGVTWTWIVLQATDCLQGKSKA